MVTDTVKWMHVITTWSHELLLSGVDYIFYQFGHKTDVCTNPDVGITLLFDPKLLNHLATEDLIV